MATQQNRNGRCRPMVRRKGHKDQYRTLPTKAAANTWAERIERERAVYEEHGGTPGESLTTDQLIGWRTDELGSVKALGAHPSRQSEPYS